jgi:hypothetical protein
VQLSNWLTAGGSHAGSDRDLPLRQPTALPGEPETPTIKLRHRSYRRGPEARLPSPALSLRTSVASLDAGTSTKLTSTLDRMPESPDYGA